MLKAEYGALQPMLKAEYCATQKHSFDAECRFMFMSRAIRRMAKFETAWETSTVADMEID